MLSSAGAAVTIARSAEEALAALDREVPDVLVSDIGDAGRGRAEDLINKDQIPNGYRFYGSSYAPNCGGPGTRGSATMASG
jgi:hypothetical protein